MTNTLIKVEGIPQIATAPAPPLDLVTAVIKALRKRVANKDYPPAGQIESLECIEQALKANEAAQLEVIAQTPIAQVAAINPAGVDVTAFVGSDVTVETLTMLHAETERRHGDRLQLFAEPVENDLWHVRGFKCKPSA